MFEWVQVTLLACGGRLTNFIGLLFISSKEPNHLAKQVFPRSPLWLMYTAPGLKQITLASRRKPSPKYTSNASSGIRKNLSVNVKGRWSPAAWKDILATLVTFVFTGPDAYLRVVSVFSVGVSGKCLRKKPIFIKNSDDPVSSKLSHSTTRCGPLSREGHIVTCRKGRSPPDWAEADISWVELLLV